MNEKKTHNAVEAIAFQEVTLDAHSHIHIECVFACEYRRRPPFENDSLINTNMIRRN